jgi:hypothetical protein
MSVSGSCHCGAVRIEAPEVPEWVGACNCSLCRRTGWLGAYYPDDSVRVTGETAVYVWGDRMIGIHHCPACGCLTHWKTLGEDFGKMGVNARLLDGFEVTAVPQVEIAGHPVEVRAIDNRGD